jgi:hypothetical protein
MFEPDLIASPSLLRPREHGSAGRGHYDVAAGPHKATDQPQILQLTGPRLEAEIGIVP